MSEEIRNEGYENSDIQFEGLTEKEAREFKPLFTKFIKAYAKKEDGVSDKEWLAKQFREELPELTEEAAEKMASETVDSIKEYDDNLKDLNEACKQGETKESWFADKVAKASSGVSVINYGNYLNSIDNAVSIANEQMLRTITTKAGDVSRSMNLDGFMAEQHHVNTFNMRAALEKSGFHAEVCVPEPGQTYGLNSFDTVIKDASGKIVHQYQFKYGADAKATINLIKSGNYNNQRLVVPAEQLEEVRAAFPGKSVEACIGGTDKVAIKSDSLTKQDVKDMQLKAQEGSLPPSNDWNDFTTKELAKNLGKNAGAAGLQAAAIAAGFTLVDKIIKDEPIDAEETVEVALKTGADAGVKAAVAGAMKVGVERGIIKVIPKGTPAGIIANLACVAIENAKILVKVAKGEYTMAQGLEHMGRTTVSMTYGIGWGMIGSTIGAAALSWIPVVGPFVGGLVGGMVGYAAGSKFGQAVFKGLKAVGKGAVSAVKKVGGAIKSGLRKVASFFRG